MYQICRVKPEMKVVHSQVVTLHLQIVNDITSTNHSNIVTSTKLLQYELVY